METEIRPENGPAPNFSKKDSGAKFWLWATFGFLALLGLQVAKFLVDNNWNPAADIASAKYLSDLDWSNWIAVANLIATSVLGGAAAGASAYAVKYLRVNVTTNRNKTKYREGDKIYREGDKYYYQASADAESVAGRLEGLLQKIETAATVRRPLSLSRQDMEDLRKLANESLKRKVQRLEALRGGLKKRAAALQANLAIERSNASKRDEELSLARQDLIAKTEELKAALHRVATATSQYEMTDSELAAAQLFLNEVDSLAQKIRQRKKSA